MAKKKSSSRAQNSLLSNKHKRLPWIILGVIILLLSFAFLTGSKSLFNLYSLYWQRNELLQEKERLEAENKQLKEEIEKLQNDMKYIEKMAREKYNLKREDEEVYKVTPE
jgi:cell division protein FtsB